MAKAKRKRTRGRRLDTPDWDVFIAYSTNYYDKKYGENLRASDDDYVLGWLEGTLTHLKAEFESMSLFEADQGVPGIVFNSPYPEAVLRFMQAHAKQAGVRFFWEAKPRVAWGPQRIVARYSAQATDVRKER